MAPGLIRNADSQALAQTPGLRTPGVAGGFGCWFQWEKHHSKDIQVPQGRSQEEMPRGHQLRDVRTCLQTSPLSSVVTTAPRHMLSPHTEFETGRRMDRLPTVFFLACIREDNLSCCHPAGLFLSPFHHRRAICPFSDQSQALVDKTGRFGVARGRQGGHESCL